MFVCVLAVVLAPTVGCAQIRIIPQEVVQEAATPSKIESVGIAIEGGEVVDLGTIGEGDQPRTFSVVWRNDSGRSAAITRIRSGCGCLVADYDKRAIDNGAKGRITLTFNPKGRIGEVQYHIYLYTTLADTNPSAVIKVVGRVESKDGKNSKWPHQIGTLQLRTKQVSAEDRVSRIAVRNGGSTPLVIKHDARLSTRGIKAYTEPQVLQPNEEGFLVVEMPEKGLKEGPAMLFLGGVNAPPRERMIEIK
jgi:hypothetical protein